MEKKFGPSEKAAKAKAFEKGKLQDGTEYELIQDELPHSTNDNTFYARFKDGKIEPFDGHRVQVKIELETSNYVKASELSGNEVRKAGEAKIYLNDKLCYGFFFREPQSALLEAHRILGKLLDASVRLSDDWDKELIGRKVYYRDTPGVVKYYFPEQGSVVIEAATKEGFPKAAHTQEDEKEKIPSFAGDEDSRSVKVDILSDQIWWWRK